VEHFSDVGNFKYKNTDITIFEYNHVYAVKKLKTVNG
jgi:hypothetical protein